MTHGPDLPDEPLAEPGTLPWDRREELGTLRAFWRTLPQVILRPQELERIRPGGRVWDSLLFVLLSTLPVGLVGGLIQWFFFWGSAQSPGAPPPIAWVVFTVATPLLFAVLALVNAALDHLALRLMGATGGFRVTLRAHALSHALWVFGGLTGLGTYVSFFGSLVTRTFAYQGLHRLPTGVALIAIFVSPLFNCFVLGMFIFLMVFLGHIHV